MNKRKIIIPLLLGVSLCLSGIGIALTQSVSAETNNVSFTVDGTIAQSYERGAYFSVPQAYCVLDGTEYSAFSKLTYPNGSTNSAANVHLVELGEYTLEYSYEQGGNKYTDTYTFSVENGMTSLFSYGSNVTAAVKPLPNYFDKTDGTIHNAQTQEGFYYASIDEGAQFTIEKKSGTTEIRYDEIIDLSELAFSKSTKDESAAFLELMFTPEDNGELETKTFTIVLTDVYDAENYLKITLKSPSAQPYITRATAAPNGLYDGMSLSGNLVDYTTNGFGIFGSMYGRYEDYNASSLSFYWDTANNELWGSPTGLGLKPYTIMNNFDNPAVVGYGNEWHGFSTGEVYLSFVVEDILTDSMSFNVLNINGKNAETDYETAGKIDLKVLTGDYNAAYDCVVCGEDYYFKLFEAVAHVPGYGSVDVYKQVYFGADKAELLEVKNEKFKVSKAGVYTMVYTVDCGFGYVTKEITLTAKPEYDKFNQLSYSFNENILNSGRYGDTIFLYDGESVGGYGNKTVAFSVAYGKEEIALSVNTEIPSFVLEKVGTYTITATVTDEIGYTYTTTQEISCIADERPIISLTDLPTVYLRNHTYTFPIPQATYLTSNGVKNADVMLFIDGTDYTEKPYVATKDFALTYKAEIEGKVTTETVACRVIDEKEGELFMTSFFHSENASFTASNNGVEFMTNGSDSEITLLNAIPVELLNFSFEALEDFTLFEGLEFSIFDTVDPNEYVTLTFRENKIGGREVLVLEVNGEPLINLASSFETKKTFSVEIIGNQLYESEKLLGKINYYLDGRAFAGFTSGYVYVKANFINESGKSKIAFKSLAGQLYTSLIKADTAGPQLIFKNQLAGFANRAKGETFVAPSAFAYDALNSANEDLKVKITDPSGALIYEGDISQSYSFILAERGTYSIVYEATDTSVKNNRTRRTFYVNSILMEAPKITLSTPTETAKVGAKYTFATANVSSALKAETTIYIVDSNYRKIYVSGSDYIFTKTGKYTVYYYVVDEYYNVAQVSYTVEVSK